MLPNTAGLLRPPDVATSSAPDYGLSSRSQLGGDVLDLQTSGHHKPSRITPVMGVMGAWI